MHPNRKYPCNESFFHVIDTEDKAYFLGLLTSDGCVRRTTISISLQRRDREILEKFAFSLETTKEVEDVTRIGSLPDGRPYTRNMSILSIHSSTMARDLAALGVTPRKSLTVEPWEGCFGPLGKHYFRGLIDGDGCIYRSKSDCWSVSLVGSLGIVNAFCNYSSSICGTKAMPLPKRNIWRVLIGGNWQAQKLAAELYGDAKIALKRKQNLAAQLAKVKLSGHGRCADIDLSALLTDYKAGFSYPQLVEKYHVSKGTCIKAVRLAGGKPREPKHYRNEEGLFIYTCPSCGQERYLKKRMIKREYGFCRTCEFARRRNLHCR